MKAPVYHGAGSKAWVDGVQAEYSRIPFADTSPSPPVLTEPHGRRSVPVMTMRDRVDRGPFG